VQIKFPFDSSKPITGEASVNIEQSIENVFCFIGERFYDNYPKWAPEVVELEPLDGEQPFIGAKTKQVREDQGSLVESVFEITDYQPVEKLTFKGLNEPYVHSYLLEGDKEKLSTRLTFRFELSEIEVFMRPFQKLIRASIEEGAENTVENIKSLMLAYAN
jgi:Polyketide cyclase / dehydrase and lipid transport